MKFANNLQSKLWVVWIILIEVHFWSANGILFCPFVKYGFGLHVGFGNRKSLKEESSWTRKEAGGYPDFFRFDISVFVPESLFWTYELIGYAQIQLDRMVMDGIARLSNYHSEHRVHIMNLLNEGRLHVKSTIDMLEEKIGQICERREQRAEFGAFL